MTTFGQTAPHYGGGGGWLVAVGWLVDRNMVFCVPVNLENRASALNSCKTLASSGSQTSPRWNKLVDTIQSWHVVVGEDAHHNSWMCDGCVLPAFLRPKLPQLLCRRPLQCPSRFGNEGIRSSNT